MTSRPDAIDPRLVLRVYAAMAATAGLALVLWGPMWILGAESYQQFALVRMFGAMIAAMGCLTFGLAAATDPASQRRGVMWLLIAHVVVGVVLAMQWYAIWQPGPISSVVLGIVTAAAASLFYLLVTMDGDVGRSSFSLTSIFGAKDASPADALQSQYEQQIREAAKQEERNYLARDLHDSVKQQIFAIHTSAAAAQAHMGHGELDELEARAALEQVRSSAREAMAEMEAMLDQLRATPLDGAGLVDVLTRQCEALQFRTGANVRFTHGPLPPNGALGPGAHQALFRVAQEALANVGRHARATEVTVSLNVDADGFTLEVQDNGAGFDPSAAQSGMGMTNMRARTDELGGTLNIRQRPGGGTTVRCSVPCALLEDRDKARRHMRNRAAIWLVILASQALFTWKTPGPLTLTVISTIGLIRSIVGYRVVSRGRKVGR